MGAGMGAAQLHEELGGQLADVSCRLCHITDLAVQLTKQMSHRLKLNAVHFSNSLEAEKALLETSQETLESEYTSHVSTYLVLAYVGRLYRSQLDQDAFLEETLVERIEQEPRHDMSDPRHRSTRVDHIRLDVYAHQIHIVLEAASTMMLYASQVADTRIESWDPEAGSNC
jgi:hypothetical protein